jgi:general secretion pathway protein D
MKTLKLSFLFLGGVVAWLGTAAAQPADPFPDEPAPPTTNEVAPADLDDVPWDAEPVAPPSQEVVPPPAPPPPPTDQTQPPASPVRRPERATFTDLSQFMPPTNQVVADGEKGLRLNFRNAPLEMVLNYLSDAAGFVIVPEVDVRGRVDVWSNQPLTKDEAVDVLNSVLSKNGFAAIRNERMLYIINKDEAKTRDIPVKAGSDPSLIPKNEEIVTQIIPVKYINATQLTRDLQPLLPTSATLTANEGGNSLVITDTQIHIRRMAEIVKALDTALSSVSSVKVFPLQYADAKSLATVIKDLFAPQQDASRGTDGRARFMFDRGGGGPPGFGGPGGDIGRGGGGSTTAGGGRAPTPKVVAVADERSNSLVVSAPSDQMPLIEDVIQQVDTNVEDVTEVRVFRLKHADAQETADLLTELFPDTSRTQTGRSRFQFGGPGGMFGGGRGGGITGEQSQRAIKETRVVAVADMRTRSVVVTAAKDLMPQIAGMIQELDADPAKKQKVFVFSLENTDPQTVQEVLQGLFPAQNNRTSGTLGTRNTSRQTGNQLNNRATQMQNQGGGRTSGFGGNSAFGGSSFGGSTGR